MCLHMEGAISGIPETVPGLAEWVVQKENYPLEMGLADFYCEGPESRHLGLRGPHSVCSNLSAVAV